jgi:lipoate-protein ligase B
MTPYRPVGKLTVFRLGTMPYHEAWELQRRLAARIADGEAPETLLLLEHPHTYTIGRRGGREHLLASPFELEARGAALIESDRGGDITYHGPGQLVGYPLLDLRRRGGDVHRYLRDLEETLIRTLAEYGLRGRREPALTGVWLGEEKVAAIGVKVSRGVTMHGFALNVNTDLSYFDLIVPCGIRNRGVTSLGKLLGEEVPLSDVTEKVERHFRAVSGEAHASALGRE